METATGLTDAPYVLRAPEQNEPATAPQAATSIGEPMQISAGPTKGGTIQRSERTRKEPKRFRMAIMAGRNLISDDVNMRNYHTAFTDGTRQKEQERIKNLLKESRNWNELKAYLRKDEFVEMCKAEL